MIWFYKFSIQLKPGETALTVFAPDWEQVEQREDYRAWLTEHQPCSLRVAEQPYWYTDTEENRNATPEEIARWTKGNAHLRMPQIEALDSSYRYRYFGNESILAPLREKLRADYAESRAKWQAEYAQHGEMTMELLKEMCIYKTVCRNLLDCGEYYPQKYMAALAEEKHPLWILSYFYEKSGRFQIEPVASDLLGIIERLQDRLGWDAKIDSKASELNSHTERMEQLDGNLDPGVRRLHEKMERFGF